MQGVRGLYLEKYTVKKLERILNDFIIFCSFDKRYRSLRV